VFFRSDYDGLRFHRNRCSYGYIMDSGGGGRNFHDKKICFDVGNVSYCHKILLEFMTQFVFEFDVKDLRVNEECCNC
jgi:hypothetical protein